MVDHIDLVTSFVLSDLTGFSDDRVFLSRDRFMICAATRFLRRLWNFLALGPSGFGD